MSDSLFDIEDNHDEPMRIKPPCFREAAEIARELLELGGWTGAQINGLERIVSGETDNAEDALYWVEKLRDTRAREEALKP